MCNVCAASDALSKEFGRETNGYGMRARGKAEFGPATYQVRRIGQPWPKFWAETTDLAGTAGALGFDDTTPGPKVMALRKAVIKGLNRSKLYAIYPGMEACHRALIWDDFWSDPLAAIESWYKRLLGLSTHRCYLPETGADKGAPA